MDRLVCVPTGSRNHGLIGPHILGIIRDVLHLKGVRFNCHVLNPLAAEMIMEVRSMDLIALPIMEWRVHRGAPDLVPGGDIHTGAALCGEKCAEIVTKVTQFYPGVQAYESGNELWTMGERSPEESAAYSRAMVDAVIAANPLAYTLLCGDMFEPPVNKLEPYGWFPKMVRRLTPEGYALFTSVAGHFYTNDGGRPTPEMFEAFARELKKVAPQLPPKQYDCTEFGEKKDDFNALENIKRSWALQEAAGIRLSCIYLLQADPNKADDFGLLDRQGNLREIGRWIANTGGGLNT